VLPVLMSKSFLLQNEPGGTKSFLIEDSKSFLIEDSRNFLLEDDRDFLVVPELHFFSDDSSVSRLPRPKSGKKAKAEIVSSSYSITSPSSSIEDIFRSIAEDRKNKPAYDPHHDGKYSSFGISESKYDNNRNNKNNKGKKNQNNNNNNNNNSQPMSEGQLVEAIFSLGMIPANTTRGALRAILSANHIKDPVSFVDWFANPTNAKTFDRFKVSPTQTNKSKQNTQKLPRGWRSAVNPAGRTYYINDITKKTQWTVPI